jgi:hypothetical protein
VVRADQEAGEDPESYEQQGDDQFSQHWLSLRLPGSGLHFTITFMGSWSAALARGASGSA